MLQIHYCILTYVLSQTNIQTVKLVASGSNSTSENKAENTLTGHSFPLLCDDEKLGTCDVDSSENSVQSTFTDDDHDDYSSSPSETDQEPFRVFLHDRYNTGQLLASNFMRTGIRLITYSIANGIPSQNKTVGLQVLPYNSLALFPPLSRVWCVK